MGKPKTKWTGLSKTVEARSYYAMTSRCLNPSHRSHKSYFDKGVEICHRWVHGDGQKSGLECFVSDMGPRPSREHSIDRIDNDGHYSPDNCRWATRLEQMNNRSCSILFTWNGETHSLIEWAKKLKVEEAFLRYHTYTHKREFSDVAEYLTQRRYVEKRPQHWDTWMEEREIKSGRLIPSKFPKVDPHLTALLAVIKNNDGMYTRSGVPHLPSATRWSYFCRLKRLSLITTTGSPKTRKAWITPLGREFLEQAVVAAAVAQEMEGGIKS